MKFESMAKKEIRDVIRTNNKHLRNIARGDSDMLRFLNMDSVKHFYLQSVAALGELEKRGSTFEDRQLRQSAMMAHTKAADTIRRHETAVQYLRKNNIDK